MGSNTIEPEERKPNADFYLPDKADFVSGLAGVTFTGKVSITLTGTVNRIGRSYCDKGYSIEIVPDSVTFAKIEEKGLSLDEAIKGSRKKAPGMVGG